MFEKYPRCPPKKQAPDSRRDAESQRKQRILRLVVAVAVAVVAAAVPEV